MDGGDWWHTTVYGPTVDELKLDFLEELREIRNTCNGKWTVAGDFNLFVDAADKNHGVLNRRMMGRFRRLLNDVELAEAPLIGRRFTWSNERAAPTLVRLDRWFHSADLDAAYPNSFLQALSSCISDHYPLQMSTNVSFHSKHRFHFESF